MDTTLFHIKRVLYKTAIFYWNCIIGTHSVSVIKQIKIPCQRQNIPPAKQTHVADDVRLATVLQGSYWRARGREGDCECDVTFIALLSVPTHCPIVLLLVYFGGR